MASKYKLVRRWAETLGLPGGGNRRGCMVIVVSVRVLLVSPILVSAGVGSVVPTIVPVPHLPVADSDIDDGAANTGDDGTLGREA
jgi:hypothetical protein